MCGIVAMVAREAPLPPDTLEQATRRLRHRGPDAVQFWHSENRRVGLGHARLSVIDLATGAQPIANEDGSLRIVVNGEFYDFERIQRELVARQHQLRTKSDSEIALHLFEEDGVNCLQQLRGEFALAIWDEPNGMLFAARDRFGIKPLYFAEVKGTLFVASEVKALAAAGVRLSWDYDSVAQNLFSSLVGSRTLYRGVHQIPPGHYLMAKNGSIRLNQYWDLNYPRSSDSAGSSSDSERIEQLRYHVREAVRLRMRSDVPVGCLLSGGLDSSAALGIARTFSSGALKAFTIAFDHPDYDESAVAGDSAAQFGADFHPIRVTNKDFAEVFPEVVWQMEGFCYNVHAPARFLLSRGVRDAGVKVVLAGEGADELTAGYRFCRDALAEPDSAWSWPEELIRGLARKNSSPGQIAALAPGLRAVATSLNYPRFFFEHRSGQMAAEQGLLNSPFLQKCAPGDPYFTFFRQIDVAGQLEGRERVRQALYLWMKSSFANYILSGERLDMAHGIEQRLPFLDHELFEFARNIPSTLLLRAGREKWILREAMKPFVTEQVYSGHKRPFVGPPSFLQDGSEMLILAQDRLRSQAMASVPFFDHRAVVAFLDRLGSIGERERSAFDPLILLLLSCAVLQEGYQLGGP
jgi:asparagine synthase (glutamine-hydrolysing)